MRQSFANFVLQHQRLRRVTNFIGTNLDEDFRLSDLADIACVSPAQLLRLYTPRVGESPMQTLQRLRLERAREQIAQDCWGSITDIALAAGYGSVAAFTHAFCRRFGASPSKLQLPSEGMARRLPLTLQHLPERKVWQFGYTGSYADNGHYKARLAWLCLQAGARRWRGWRLNDRDRPFCETSEERVELSHFVPMSDHAITIREADCVTHPAALYAVVTVAPEERATVMRNLSQRVSDELGCMLVEGRSLERDLHIRDYQVPQERRIALYVPVRPLRG